MQPSFEELGTPLIDVEFVVVDLETTGLSPGRDRITEIGAVKVRGGDVLGEFHTLVRPDRSVPPAVTAVTGITDAMLRGAPTVGAVLPAFVEFSRGAVLVAHNARFDVGFLDAELERCGHPRLTATVVDTASVARRILRDEVRDVRLSTLARHLRARVAPEHRALTDARATVDVLHGLLERAGALGATTLEDLQDYARSSSDTAFRKVALVADAPRTPGVYRFLDGRGDVLYVGKAVDLRARLRQYFGRDPRRRIADMVRETAEVRWELAPTELEAAVREVRAIQASAPRYNRRSKHPTRAVHVKLTDERFPRLSIVSGTRDDGGTYVGPVASRRLAQRLVDALHEALPLRQCTMRLRKAQDHPACVLKDLGRCGAPCDGTQSVAAYQQVAETARRALREDPVPLLDALRRRMESLAADGRYERAAEARRRLHTVATTLDHHRRLRALAGVGELVALRADGDEVEAVQVRAGRLVATVRVPAPATDGEVRDRLALAVPLAPRGGTVDGEDAEELRLVGSWLDRPGTRVVHAEGGFALPWRGGAELRRTADEARSVARQVRRDREQLRGDKVARRVSA